MTKFDNVKLGDKLIADGGFECLTEGAELEVKQDPINTKLYVDCGVGEHYLDGQVDEHGYLVGFRLAV